MKVLNTVSDVILYLPRKDLSRPFPELHPGEMSSETLTTISPSTNQPVLTRPALSDSDIARLPATSTQAFSSYARLIPLSERQAIVRKALQLILDKQDVLARELTEQMGRPIAYTAVEIKTAVKRAEYLLKISAECLKDTEGEAEKGFKRFIRKAPVGPVLILFAWNVRRLYDLPCVYTMLMEIL